VKEGAPWRVGKGVIAGEILTHPASRTRPNLGRRPLSKLGTARNTGDLMRGIADAKGP